MPRKILLPILLFLSHAITAQIGGQSVFQFLNHGSSPRSIALGNGQIALRSDDLALAAQNPAMLNEKMNNGVTFNHEFLLAGITDGYFGAAHYFEKQKLTLNFGIQYINYGDFKAVDEYGNTTGSFTAGDYAIGIGGAYKVNERISVGTNLKFITSQYENYNTTGLAADLGGLYFNEETNFGAAIVLRSAGAQLSTYTSGAAVGRLPYNLEIGFTQKLRKAPLRLGILFHDLQKWDLSFDNPFDKEAILFGEAPKAPSAFSSTIDNLFRHIVFNGELAFGKKENFRLSFGYNHQMKSENSISSIRGLTGFSFGLGFKVSRFRIEYALNRYHVAGGGDYLGVSTTF
jgi:hypothetical protein